MRIIVANDYDEMSSIAAQMIRSLVNEKPDAVLGLATGSTPVGIYEALIKMNKEGMVDFSKVTTFNLDEYLGLEEGHKQSYRHFMNENFFDHINIEKKKTFLPSGIAENMEIEAKEYDAHIDALGGIDLQILGVGSNGHIAFNEPNETLSMGTHVEALKEETIKANSRFFETIDQVPRQAITMGIGQILKARKIILLASGKKKVVAIKGILSGKLTTNNPVSLLQLHQNITIIIDKAIEEELIEEKDKINSMTI